MLLKNLMGPILLLASSFAYADAVNIYVANDLRPVEEVAELAANAAAVLEGHRLILVRDAQVLRLNAQEAAVRAAQAQQIEFFVCEADLAATHGAMLPSGISVVHAPKEGVAPALRTTFEKRLEKMCTE